MSKTSTVARRRPAFLHPPGSGAPKPIIDETCDFLIIDDSDIGRDMLDLEGPGGPENFGIDLAKVLAEATKVIVAVGGPSLIVQWVMQSAVRPKGYGVVVDTPSSRFATWAEFAVDAREGQRGLALIGPRRLLPTELADRCVADMEHLPDFGIGKSMRTLH